MFEQFPYTNFHELNLDWIIKRVMEAYGPDNPPTNIVLSVDGQTGNVRVFPNAIIQLPTVQEGTWNFHRIAGGQETGIQFTPNSAERIESTHRYKMYDEGNPPPYPVQSVNGQTGIVTITIPVQSVNGETGVIVLYRNAVTRLPDVEENVWNIYRICGETQRGIQFTPNSAERIEGLQRYYIYDSGNPPPYPVTSVNGQTGAVSIPKVVTDLAAEILNIDTASPENYWGLVREVSTGTASIYLDTSNNTIKAYISYVSSDEQTTVTLPLLTHADIPSSSGVVSINGKTGAVTLYGTDIYTDSNSNTTVDQALAEVEQKNTAQDTSLAGLENGIAIIVDGDTASVAVPAGGYAYLKNNTHGLAEGLYTNTSASAFPATGGTANGTVFTAAPQALNKINNDIATLNSKLVDTEWQTLSISSYATGDIKYRKIGNVCFIYVPNLRFTGMTENVDNRIVTLPSNIRPRDMLIQRDYNDNGYIVCTAGIDIHPSAGVTSGYFSAFFCFITD